jgi:DNA-directed RNA polymerase subunit RPC12/RpoP
MFETLNRVMSKAGDTLKLRCEACGHRADMTRERSLSAFGPDASPFEIRHRVVCTACGARGQSAAWV